MQRFRATASLVQLRRHSTHSRSILITHGNPKSEIAALLKARQIRFYHDFVPQITKNANLKYEHGECDKSPIVEGANCSKCLRPTKHTTASSHPQAIITQQRQTTHALIDAHISNDIPKILSFHAPGYQHVYLDRTHQLTSRTSTEYISSLSRAFEHSNHARIVVYNIFESTKARTVRLTLFIESEHADAREGSSPDFWITWILHFDESGEKIVKCEESSLDDKDRFGLWLA